MEAIPPTITAETGVIRLSLGRVRYGQTIMLDACARNTAESLGTAFCGPKFYRDGVRITDHGAVIEGGECQLHGFGWKDYHYRFAVPPGADSAELWIYVKGCGAVCFRSFETRVSQDVPLPGAVCPSTKCVAHLGMIGYAPRNTMPAFQLARRAGFRECVLNTNDTKDGMIVALHNDTIDETSNGTGHVFDMTLAELRQYDFGGWFSDVYKGEPIPLVAEVLAFMAKSGMRPVLRLSSHFTGDKKRYLHLLFDMVQQYGLLGRCTAKGFSKQVLCELSQIAGNGLRYGYCCSDFDEADARWMRTLGDDVYLDVLYRNITERHVQTALRNGAAIEAWIINDFEGIVRLAEMGVTGFTTDFYCLDGCIF